MKLLQSATAGSNGKHETVGRPVVAGGGATVVPSGSTTTLCAQSGEGEEEEEEDDNIVTKIDEVGIYVLGMAIHVHGTLALRKQKEK